MIKIYKLSLYALFSSHILCQTPTALWYLDTPTTTSYVKNEYNGGDPGWYLD